MWVPKTPLNMQTEKKSFWGDEFWPAQLGACACAGPINPLCKTNKPDFTRKKYYTKKYNKQSKQANIQRLLRQFWKQKIHNKIYWKKVYSIGMGGRWENISAPLLPYPLVQRPLKDRYRPGGGVVGQARLLDKEGGVRCCYLFVVLFDFIPTWTEMLAERNTFHQHTRSWNQTWIHVYLFPQKLKAGLKIG